MRARDWNAREVVRQDAEISYLMRKLLEAEGFTEPWTAEAAERLVELDQEAAEFAEPALRERRLEREAAWAKLSAVA
jgi:hypothetical protein